MRGGSFLGYGLVVLALLGGARVARAAPPKPGSAAKPAAAPSATPEVPISEQARSHFSAGVNLLQDPDGARYEEAYREFKAAYADSPSWKILGNLALAAMKLERDGEAIDAYQKYLAEAGSGIDNEEREQVKRDLFTLTASMAHLELSGLPEGATLLDERVPVQGQAVRNQFDGLKGEAKLGVRPGHHRVTAHAAGFTDEVWELDARPSSTQAHEFALKVAETAAPAPVAVSVSPELGASNWSTQKTVAVVAGGIGVVGAAVGTVFFFSYKSKNDDAKAICSGSSDCPEGSAAQHASLVDDAKSARTLTYVGWGVGVAGLGAAAALYFTAPSRERERAQAARSPWLVPVVGPGQAGAVLRGSF